MSAVANPSPAPTTSRTSLKRRHNSSSDDEACVDQKRYFYVLAPESSDETSDGPESIYSVQAKSTDVARDTSDTSTKGSWSDSDERLIELEVVTYSESEMGFPFPMSSASSPEELQRIPSPNEDQMVIASSLLSAGEESDDDGEAKLRSIGRFPFCKRCQGPNSETHFMYCIGCHRQKKRFLPERPKGKKSTVKTTKVDVASDGNDSGIHSQSLSSSNLLQEDPSAPPQLDNKDTNSNHLCQICMSRQRNGGFCHGNIIHVYSCYQCSIKTYKQRGRCPICNRKPNHVAKMINA